MPFASTSRSARRRPGRLHALALALGALAAGLLPLAAQDVVSPAASATYRAQTDLVVLQVAVVDGQHHFVAGLQREDFAVYEEGARQEVVLFASAEAPLDVLLVIDTSVSMTSRLTFVQEAAVDLVGSLRNGDRAGLILFNSVVQLTHAMSEDRDSLVRAVRAATPTGATALYEAVYVALNELRRFRRAETDLRRQALVVLSDGADNSSRIGFEQLLDEAKSGAVTIFTILPGMQGANANRFQTPSREAATVFEMRRLAEDTGGRAFVPASTSDLAGVYDDVASELREQYWLAYAPTSLQPGFRRVSVRVTARPGLLARTRSGYDAGRRDKTSSAVPDAETK